jgi:glycine/D-amino acid oxidase-like deaminating enzyme
VTSLWLTESAPFAHGAVLPERSDVVVIGGGIAGVSVALHLARRGIEVTLLEREALAARASGRNDGQMLLGLGEHYHRIHGQFGAERARQLWQFLEQNHAELRATLAAEGIACSLDQSGGLRLAETGHEWHELEQAAALLADEGRPHRLIPTAELPRWLPAGVGFHGALHLPGEAVVQPVEMVRGLAAAAARAGARIVEQAPVARVDGDAGDFMVQLDDGRTTRSTMVVHCTSVLARELDRSGGLQRMVFPFRGQVIATGPLPAAIVQQFPPSAMSSNFGYEYFRVHGQRFVLGGMRWSVPGEELGLIDDSLHNPAITENLREFATTHFPVLAEVDFPHVWTGIMAGTHDGLPLVGALPGAPGAFVLGAFNGYGLSFAFLAGRCLAEMIVDGKSEHAALPMFAPRRFGAD